MIIAIYFLVGAFYAGIGYGQGAYKDEPDFDRLIFTIFDLLLWPVRVYQYVRRG